jgi:predicted dehydrogenase
MDYTQSPLHFRLRKVARYTRLYGPRRTLVKIRGQYHMRAAHPPELRGGTRADAHVGIIGCGNFAYSHISYFLTRRHGAVIRGVMDRNLARAASLGRRYRAAYATDDAERMFTDPAIDLVYIASNHASHADYAIHALAAGKHVHIEKPHVVTRDQLVRLAGAMQTSSAKVRLGFNRPESPLGSRVRELLAAQNGTTMLNWFVAGHDIPRDHWYYRDEEGGRVLGNLCHWTDFVLRMIDPADRFPIDIRPLRAERSDADVAVCFRFGDGSIAAITFSAKGHTFEGVRERLAAHRGDLLVSLQDFHELRIDLRDRRDHVRLRFRDHGHESAILRSYAMTGRDGRETPGLDLAYVWETADLFLSMREALEADEPRRVDAFSLAGRAAPVSEPVPVPPTA